MVEILYSLFMYKNKGENKIKMEVITLKKLLEDTDQAEIEVRAYCENNKEFNESVICTGMYKDNKLDIDESIIKLDEKIKKYTESLNTNRIIVYIEYFFMDGEPLRVYMDTIPQDTPIWFKSSYLNREFQRAKLTGHELNLYFDNVKFATIYDIKRLKNILWMYRI